MLLLDAGNSRIKWVCERGGTWLHQGAVPNNAWEYLRPVFAALPYPQRVLASNVAGEQMANNLRTLCLPWQLDVEFIQAQAEQCGVRNHYTQPTQLGSDRWAALIAAYKKIKKSCLVVNCGTATTLDALSEQGDFLGGLILPGVELMTHSLGQHTAQLRVSEGQISAFPVNTADAIYSGALRATIGAITQQLNLLQQQSKEVICVLSGGAAKEVGAYLETPYEYIDNLVLHGLQIIGENTQC